MFIDDLIDKTYEGSNEQDHTSLTPYSPDRVFQLRKQHKKELEATLPELFYICKPNDLIHLKYEKNFDFNTKRYNIKRILKINGEERPEIEYLIDDDVRTFIGSDRDDINALIINCYEKYTSKESYQIEEDEKKEKILDHLHFIPSFVISFWFIFKSISWGINNFEGGKNVPKSLFLLILSIAGCIASTLLARKFSGLVSSKQSYWAALLEGLFFYAVFCLIGMIPIFLLFVFYFD